jgi:hypothetical protein
MIARNLLFTVGAHESLKCGSESGGKVVDQRPGFKSEAEVAAVPLRKTELTGGSESWTFVTLWLASATLVYAAFETVPVCGFHHCSVENSPRSFKIVFMVLLLEFAKK